MLKRIKVINSHAGFSRWLGEVSSKPIGYISRQSDIPSPYAYSPTHVVWNWKGQPVITVETRHKRYEVFEVPADMARKTEEEAIRHWHSTHEEAQKQEVTL